MNSLDKAGRTRAHTHNETYSGLWHYIACITEPMMENSGDPKTFVEFLGGFLGVFVILLLGLPFYIAIVLTFTMGTIGGIIAIVSLPFTLYAWYFKKF